MNEKLALLEWGLQEREIDVYLYILKNGSMSANKISQGTGILRQTVYEIIDKLQVKGLVNEVILNNKKHFSAESPHKLKTILEEKSQIIDGVLNNLVRMSELPHTSTNVHLYKGFQGMKMVLRDPLACQSEIKGIHPTGSEEFFQEFFIGNFSVMRIKNKIPIKIIRGEIETDAQKKYSVTSEKEYREVRLLSKLKLIKAGYIIYDNKLSMLNYNKESPFAIIIEDQYIVQTFSIFFDLFWDSATLV
ncbi:MAG: TrmB family transcriptional regulator [Candidatus Woesearchaeota archaeon]